MEKHLCDTCTNSCKKKDGLNYGSCMHHTNKKGFSEDSDLRGKIDQFYDCTPALVTKIESAGFTKKDINKVRSFVESNLVKDYWIGNFYFRPDPQILNSPVVEMFWREKIELEIKENTKELTIIENRLPVADTYYKTGNKYYLVDLGVYGIGKAMYLNKDGEEGWYSSYTSKVIVPVLKWSNESI